MSNKFFTADTHWFHDRMLEFGRPFSSVHEMNETMIYNWNNVVTKSDIVYHLGDFAFTPKDELERLVKRLNGQIHWIFGNHDQNRKSTMKAEGFVWKGFYKEVKVDKQNIILFHYPLATWNKMHRGSIQLHGHCHGKLNQPVGYLRMDVGVDCNGFAPISAETILSAMQTKKRLATDCGCVIGVDHHVLDFKELQEKEKQ